MGTEAEQYRLQINNDKVARWLLGDNAAEGIVRLLVLILAYIVSSVLVLDWLMRWRSMSFRGFSLARAELWTPASGT
jgi:hypothetical protein